MAFFSELEGLCRREAFAAHLAPLRRKSWFVYAKAPFAGPEAVLAYLARYTHRVAIPNSRLLGLDERGVTFRYKDYHLIAPHACGRTSLSPRRLQRRVRHRRSCQNHPVNGRRDDKLPTVIGDPPPVTTASASPTQATAPSNPHRRQTAHPAPRGSFLGGFGRRP